ncbi:MAG: type II toxin-antitoxin system HicA family toxin [Loigolactobacillus coryniformis]|jgi:predicted RNA binding protein YcfA (HicA-like mRNA interferase family)|uniref:type II toxin-antitoxin system HicA family toxin n=1 Tax=Loigolactobacillus coryniformis TaxID=1610 RepID=UPI0026488633|nr:type II toxin-antitoxin system HicA family toxin [Loigolactobacillus coryniformis]MDN5951138.1 type II toxin-antitoxin system HicA family toxin [Loigolactobacillus coryniformis]MDN5953045.1 type II toxin-antitoxin system HicA family toxin [Loigolactobacillus coryniformis]
MPLKPKQLEKLVLQQGFVREKDKGKGGHRRYVHLDGRTTEINFHSREVRKGTQEKILKDIGLK